MKIKSKILSMALIPLLVLGINTVIMANNRINEVLTENIENGLRAAAVSVRDTISYVDVGEFSVDEGGNLYKGAFNLTESESIADNVQKATHMDITVFTGTPDI